jgi:S-adenosylmethionine-diacylglycerol 3-amino-3-carboxypropyl transferase
MKVDIQRRARFDFVRYAQCWEDPALNAAALEVNENDYVLSIASGGDNTFALLLDNPRFVVGCDISPVQIYICELKKEAIRRMDYPDVLQLLGVTYTADRMRLYDSIKSVLSPDAREYFDARRDDVELGIIHCGKFERYFRHFRHKVLPLTHGRRIIDRLLACMTLEDQREVYRDFWDTTRWRTLFKIFCSEFVLGRFGRDPAFFKYVKEKSLADVMQRRIKLALTEMPIQENFYLHYMLKGRYLKRECLPPYLLEPNFETLRQRIDRIEFHIESCEDHMRRVPRGTVTKINYSNIFEYLSEEAMEEIFDVLVEYGAPGLTIEYRNLFVPRSCPAKHRDRFESFEDRARELNMQERSFFYTQYVIERLRA